MHILMLGCFNPMFPVTAPLALLLFINTTRMQISESMVIELGTLSMESSLHILVFTSTIGMGCEATVYFPGV